MPELTTSALGLRATAVPDQPGMADGAALAVCLLAAVILATAVVLSWLVI